MLPQRKLFVRTVAGLLVFGVVTIGLRAASHEINRASTTTVATLSQADYTFTVKETPLNPNDHINSLGIHSDGYYYQCEISKGKEIVSTYVIRRWKGFHGQQVSIMPLQLKTHRRLMAEIEIVPDSGPTIVADCIISPPAPDDQFGGGIVNWRGFEMEGV
ncbi:MAG: hypothetical protein P4L33_05995 [Capsulimonadaceae bacterium]|nr:hypothetical protein [Capsulimonadaceae bacterium]